MKDEKKTREEDAFFVQLVLMFQTAGMQQLGKLMNPLTKKTERNIEQAKFSIDLLDMIKSKTKGNLSGEEEKLLEQALYGLRMNYLEELKGEEKGEQKKDSPEESSSE